MNKKLFLPLALLVASCSPNFSSSEPVEKPSVISFESKVYFVPAPLEKTTSKSYVTLKSLDQLNKLKKSQIPVLVEYSTEWCGFCRKVEGFMNTAANERYDFLFAKYDVEKNPNPDKIGSFPTIKVYQNNKQICEYKGAPSDYKKFTDFLDACKLKDK